MDSHFWGIIPGLYFVSVPPLRSLLVDSWWSPRYSAFRTTYILLSGTFRGHTVSPSFEIFPLSKTSTREGHSQVDDSWQHLCPHQTKKEGFRTPVLSLHSLNFISFFPQRDVAVGILAYFRLRWLFGALSAGPGCWFVKCQSSKKLPELETHWGDVGQLLKGSSVSFHSQSLPGCLDLIECGQRWQMWTTTPLAPSTQKQSSGVGLTISNEETGVSSWER